MIVYRCQRCGEETTRVDVENEVEYEEVYQAELCKRCRKKRKGSAEEKLADAIKGNILRR